VSASTPKKQRKASNDGIKIHFNMSANLNGLQLKEYINRHLIEKNMIPYLHSALSWRTGWDFILVEPRDRTRIFRQSPLNEQSEQDKNGALSKKQASSACNSFL
jgi:hypothetical protein